LEATFITQFGLLFLVVVIISFFIKLIRQPIILGYVLAGLFFSMFYSGNVAISNQIVMLTEIGITFLLFLIGLEFDLTSLKYLGKDMFITTLIQSIVFFGMGFGISILFGFTYMEATYIAILFMFSSTLLVAKWIEDKKESSTLHGKITMGTLILQDIFAIVAISILGVVENGSVVQLFLAPILGIILIIITFFIAKYVITYLLKLISKYTELVFIFSIGICFVFVELAPLLGYSTTIGAFLGGIVLGNTMYRAEILGKLKPLVLFFNLLFFVGLGFQLNPNLTMSTFIFILIIIALTLFIKPIVIYFTFRNRKYDVKTSFLSSIYLAQISEFGMIIVGVGVMSGAISANLTSISIFTVISTMIISSYFIKYDKKIYAKFESLLRKPVKKKKPEEKIRSDCNILFFGYYELTKELYKKLHTLGKKVMVVENDPEHIALLKRDNVPYIYSTASDPEFFEHMHFEEVELVISNRVDIDENKMIINNIKHQNAEAVVIVTAKSLKDSLELYDCKADYVIYPAYLNEQHISVLIEDFTKDVSKVIGKKIQDIVMLKQKQQRLKQVKETSFFVDIDTFVKKLKGARSAPLPKKSIKKAKK
jgi:Kef-type K+ transport system membrane component KefB/Trk K+ transport system NAD-binding subunit